MLQPRDRLPLLYQYQWQNARSQGRKYQQVPQNRQCRSNWPTDNEIRSCRRLLIDLRAKKRPVHLYDTGRGSIWSSERLPNWQLNRSRRVRMQVPFRHMPGGRPPGIARPRRPLLRLRAGSGDPHTTRKAYAAAYHLAVRPPLMPWMIRFRPPLTWVPAAELTLKSNCCVARATRLINSTS